MASSVRAAAPVGCSTQHGASRGSSARECSSSCTSIARHVGLRVQKPDRLRSLHASVSFHERVQRSLSIRGSSGAGRAQVTMMPIGVPKVPYRTPQEGGWQWVDIWNVLYRERIIFVGQYIDEEFGNQLLATMLYLDSIDSTKPMFLYLNSPGGDLTPSMALYDTINSIKSSVGTLALGYAYNNAGLLLSAGEKGLRVAMPLTRIALQSPSGAARGQADDIQNEAKELSRVRNYVFQQVARNTGQPVDKVTKDLSRIKRFSAQEALDYGLIDRIVRPRRIKPDAKRQQTAGVGLG